MTNLCNICENVAFCASAAKPDEVMVECDFYEEDVALTNKE